MRFRNPFLLILVTFLSTVCFPATIPCADTLFLNRKIHLSNEANRLFSAGVTGTTAGYNYLPLIENAKQEALSLGDLGYWELVPDPPSFLRNNDLQVIIENSYKGNFRVEFEYDDYQKNIVFRIKEGDVKVKVDSNDYYPKLIIEAINAGISALSGSETIGRPKRYIFFDFNSFDVDLRKYYGDVKKFIKNHDYHHYFYYYETGNYNSYYFKVYPDITDLNTDKMGLSQEDGSVIYYQKILDNIKARFGSDFAEEIIIVSRFGEKFSDELKSYSYEIGIRTGKEISFQSYENISFDREQD